MIEVTITDEMRRRAQGHVDRLPTHWNDTIRKSDGGEFVGCLGEEVWLYTYPGARSASPDPSEFYHYDVKYKGFRFEIKTKDRHVVPEPSYACNIPMTSTFQEPDFYSWVSLLNDEGMFTKAYICGYIHRKKFYKIAKHRPEGDIDPSNNQVEQAKGGSYQCTIADLWPPEELRGMQEPGTWPYGQDKQKE